MTIIGLLALSTALHFCQAQFPREREGLTVITSPHNEDVKISYKENNICETTPGVRSFAGYVDLPPGILASLGVNDQTWPINTFWWFFEARNDPKNAPTLIWINGGPGSSSSAIPLSYNGPCKMRPDANSTMLWDWSWNRDVNMLYVDQPVQVGLSYDTLQNITYNLIDGTVTLLNDTTPIPEQNTILQVGTWASTDSRKTTSLSVTGAYAFWHFAQVWFQYFPEYQSNDKRISLSGVSYGGKYAPAMFAFFEEQNERIRNGSWNVPGQSYVLPLDTLMIENGCIDIPVAYFSYPAMAVNNTYDIKAVSDTTLKEMLYDLHRKGGCLDQAYKCGNLSLQYDPREIGVNATVNSICSAAYEFCVQNVLGPFDTSGRSLYDITIPSTLSRAPPFARAYMQRPHVQEALGMRLNWSSVSSWVNGAYRREGDFARPGWIQKMAYLLDRGIKVAFVYGDKDYICNWMGGEAVSLAINYTFTPDFHAAGYAPIQTNASYIGGQVRQYGNLSFARVYQAPHGSAGQQPETAYKIMQRTLFDLDIATGTIPVTGNHGKVYSSKGPPNSLGFRNQAIPVNVLQVCYVLDVSMTCTDDQVEMIANGTAVIKDYMIVDRNSTARYPEIVGNGTNAYIEQT